MLIKLNIKSILFKVLTICILLMYACEEPVVLNLPIGEEKLVVNGWITNEDEVYQITLNNSVSFNSPNEFPSVNGAEVFVTDRLSFRYDFIEVENSGIYESNPSDLIGKQGEAYILHIILDNGKVYQSEREVLNPLPILSSISSDFFFDAGVSIDDLAARKFFIQGQVQDIPNIKNYYRWKLKVNGIDRNSPDDLFLFDDKFTDGVLFDIEAINITFIEGDLITLQHLSLTENAYKYYEQLSDQLSSGIIPNTPPAIIFGNIKNVNDSTEVVLGFFGASAVSTTELEITP